MNNTLIKISTLVSYLVMVGVNYLAVTLPLAGRDTGEISDNYPNLFAPAGYAFSIWSLIYTLLLIYVIYQFREGSNVLVSRVNKIFILNGLLNAAWIFAWHYDLIWLSVLIMLGILITLIKIADTFRGKQLTPKEKWFVRLPFSIYFGWITVATIANITIFLVSIGWNGFGLSDVFWTVVVLLVGAAIGIWRAIHDRNIPYCLVLVWAYGAILAKHLSASAFAGSYPAVIYTASLCILLFALTVILLSLRPRNK